MRMILWVFVMVAACGKDAKRDAPQPVARGDAGAVAVALPPDAAAARPIDLLHASSAIVAVSSIVVNPAISAFDLVDDDLKSAWNARTGDAHPWIAFRVPKAARVDTIRMTVGFTTTGPEGDYFTMNLRIDKVRILHDGVLVREVDLDPENRGLQDIPIGAAGGDYKIEIVHTVKGTKPNWREVCVSELEVLGVPPAGKLEDVTMKLGSLDGKSLVDTTAHLTALEPYPTLDAFCAAYKTRSERPCEGWEKDMSDVCRGRPEPATCGYDVASADKAKLPATWPAGWQRARWFGTTESLRNEMSCGLAIEAGGRVYVIEHLIDSMCGGSLGQWDEGRYEVAMHGRWLVIATSTVDAAPNWTTTRTEHVMVCGSIDGVPACTDSFDIGHSETQAASGGTAGADGLEVETKVQFQFRYNLVGDVLDITKWRGKPAEYNLGALGKRVLR